MTDKQIIIDGVDVSECEYHSLNKNNCSLCSLSNNLICSYKPFCYYKQLKRKEQECEELKAKCKKYGEINEQETKDYAELKAERDSYIDKYFLESQKVLKLNKVLKEIKEICKKESGWVNCSDNMPTETAIFAEQILQKISECEE